MNTYKLFVIISAVLVSKFVYLRRIFGAFLKDMMALIN